MLIRMTNIFKCTFMLAMLAAVLLVPFAILKPNAAYADTPTYELSIRHGSAHCGSPITFTLEMTNSTPQTKYAVTGFFLYGEDGRYSVYDYSNINGNDLYQSSNTFDFTFYASGRYEFWFAAMDTSVSPIAAPSIRYSLYIDDPAYPTVSEKADQIVAQMRSEGVTGQYEQALWLHDWLVDNAKYDYSFHYCNAEGVLARGTGTCESYVRAYSMLLNRVGIENTRAEDRKVDNHVWSKAKLNGKWYNIDVTWDDLEGTLTGTSQDMEHMYFGLPDDVITLVHEGYAGPNAGQEATSYEDNWFIRSGKIAQFSDIYISQVQDKINAGFLNFDLDPQYSYWPDGYKDVIYNIVAYDLEQKRWKSSNSSMDVVFDVDYSTDKLSFVGREVDPQQTPPPTQDMYRLYNSNSGEHFYTAATVERDALVGAGWKYEGVGWTAPLTSDLPVYRLYSGTDHHYTTSPVERDALVSAGWKDEGIGWYSAATDGVPLYRQYNPNVNPRASRNNSGSHNYTTSLTEHEFLCANGWYGEGIGWYGVAG